MESELINFPILFTCEATKQEQEMRLLLKKEYVHDDNHDILMVRSDDADAEGFALAEIMGKDELYDLIFNKVSITLITSMKQFQIYEEVKKNV